MPLETVRCPRCGFKMEYIATEPGKGVAASHVGPWLRLCEARKEDSTIGFPDQCPHWKQALRVRNG